MNKVFKVVVVSGLLLFSVSGWSASTKEEIQALSAQVAAMQKDLVEIKKLLKEGARAPAPAPSANGFKEQTVSIGDSPYKGKANATVTLIEFSDYQCPYCSRNYREVMPALVSEYVDTGKLKFVMRENPIPSLHRNAMNASQAALCAQDQDKYWEMHNLLFENQKELAVENLKGFASDLGLDSASFDECLDSGKYKQRINSDIQSGAKLGIRGTPGFILGLTDQKDTDKAHMTVFIKGAQSLDSFKGAIDGLLANAK